MRIRTKNMYYEVSEASNELELFAINDSGVYFRAHQLTPTFPVCHRLE